MVVQITTAFSAVRRVQSALYPGVSGLHLLCYCVSVRRSPPVLVTQQLSISVPEPGRKHDGRPYHIDGTVEYAVRRTCFPPGFCS
jgi:hypothetical protein